MQIPVLGSKVGVCPLCQRGEGDVKETLYLLKGNDEHICRPCCLKAAKNIEVLLGGLHLVAAAA